MPAFLGLSGSIFSWPCSLACRHVQGHGLLWWVCNCICLLRIRDPLMTLLSPHACRYSSIRPVWTVAYPHISCVSVFPLRAIRHLTKPSNLLINPATKEKESTSLQ